mmetsp:Transcript_79187/g.227087  ORF Transcript_79187/g.227087 Transcript_79187/m.227087 type:complete len:89 (+) Transcript_79187:101-367(+)
MHPRSQGANKRYQNRHRHLQQQEERRPPAAEGFGNQNTVRVSHRSPGSRSTDGNAGWFGLFVKCCVSKQNPARLSIGTPPFPIGSFPK